MDRAEKYANWIIANKDKKGSPEFEKVVAAYKLAKDDLKPVQEYQSHDPTEGQSFGQNAAAGIGKAVYDTGRGIGQLGRMALPERFADALNLPNQADIDESKRLDAPLMNTSGGVAGNIAGNLGMILAPGGAAMKYGGAIPKVGSSIAALGKLVTMPQGLIPSMAGGAILGGTQPVASDDSRMSNISVGAAAGGIVPAALGGASVIKSLGHDIWTDKFAKRAAGSVLNRLTSGRPDDLAQRALTGNVEKVPGYKPTLAEALSEGGKSDVGISTLQSVMQSADPFGAGAKSALKGRAQDQDSALLATLDRYILPNEAKSSFQDLRRGATKDLYENLPFVQSNPDLERILSTPAAQKAMPYAKEIAGNQYRTFGEEITALKNPIETQVKAIGNDSVEGGAKTHWTKQPVNEDKDNILTAIRKLGGINKDMAQENYGNEMWKDVVHKGVFRNEGGQSLDDLAARLSEQGYLPEGATTYDVVDALYSPEAKRMFSHVKNSYDDVYKPEETEVDSLTSQLKRLADAMEKKATPKPATEKPLKSAYDNGYWGRDLQSIQQGMKSVLGDPSVPRQMKQSMSGPASDFNQFLEQNLPDLLEANKLYAKHSQPLNQSSIFDALKNTRVATLKDTANDRLQDGNFLRLLENEKRLLDNADDLTGVTTLDQALSPGAKSMLDNMKSVIRNRASSNSDAAAKGSPTAQNLIGYDLVSSGLNALGLPENWAGNKFLQTAIERPSKFIFQIPEMGVRNTLAESFVDPKFAAELSELAKKARGNKLINKAMKYQFLPAQSISSYLTQQ